MLVESGARRDGVRREGRPDKVGLIALFSGEALSGFSRGLLLIAVPWWVAGRAGEPVAGGLAVLAIVLGWRLGRARMPRFVRALRPHTASWVADLTLALFLWVILLVAMPAGLEIALVIITAFVLAALQRHAVIRRPRMVDRVAQDARLEPAPVARRLHRVSRWSPLAGMLLALPALSAAGESAALWIAFLLSVNAGEFVFVAVPRGDRRAIDAVGELLAPEPSSA